MSCTTILVGKKASNDFSTIAGRTDDGFFDVKKLVSVTPDKQPRTYKSVIAHLEVKLPDNPMRYTSCPSVNLSRGIWPAAGINAAGVGMTATETISSNPRVLGADPLVYYKKAATKKEKDIPGGIGEEDLVTLILPYIHSAREGVLRLASLLEQYGTYESNGIAFHDADEVWWAETIGGHHFIATRIKDDEVVINPNQFGTDSFDLEDGLGKQESHICSPDLKEFILKNHLDLNIGGVFNPRNVFGSRTDLDHIYNTPRAWYMGRYLAPYSYKWEGENADFRPESDNIPWSLKPDRKVTAEDVKYLLSSHYQGTPYDPYSGIDTGVRGKYRSIGINRTGDTCICQIRSDMPKEICGIEWICFGSTAFDAALPLYAGTDKMPDYVSKVTNDVSTDNFYWSSRLIGAMADAHYAAIIPIVERYQSAVASKGHEIIAKYDRSMLESNDFSLIAKANEELCEMAKKQTAGTLSAVLAEASKHMKNGFNREDN